MNSLASKDSYLQKFASKICSRQDHEPRNSKFVHFKGDGEASSKSKRKQKRLKQKAIGDKKNAPQSKQKSGTSPDSKSTNSPDATAAAKTNTSKNVANGKAPAIQLPKGGSVTSGFSTVDLLRKRLHEKIEESKGQGTQDACSDAVQAKRAKRKLERERKKRKKKEFQMKRLAEKAGEELAQQIKEEESAPATVPAPAAATPGTAKKRDETAILFNTVETVEEVYMDKMTKKQVKKKRVKGELTPLTGRNYKQLLGRVEARKAKLEELRAKDEGKARAMEEKMKWTNVLYKAEGLRIKDDEAMLRTSLRKKEKTQEQKQRRWDTRAKNVDDKMQRRQDKRRRNLHKQKSAKVEKKKDRARKKGRVLPGDLKKVLL